MSLPQSVHEVLGFGTKHPIRDNVNEIQFLVENDRELSELKLNQKVGEKLCEKEAAAKMYTKTGE